MAIDWGAVLGALAQYWGSRGSSGDTPNFYNVPMSPEDKAWNDRRMALYDQGGSERMKAVGSAAQQFFAGMPTTANPTYASPFMRGQPFAGGIQLPRIDLSKFDFGKSMPTGSSGNQAPGPGDNGKPTQDDRRAAKDYGYGSGSDDPINPASGGGPFGPDPGGMDRIPGPGTPAQTPGEMWNSFSSWWADYRARNPNWKQQGLKALLGAAAGVFGGPLASTLFRALFMGNPEDPGKDAAARFEQFWTSGTSNGSAYTGGQRPPGMGGGKPAPGVGVTTGRNNPFSDFGKPGSVGGGLGDTSGFAGGSTTRYVDKDGNARDHYTPSFGDQVNAGWMEEWWRNLQRPPGGGAGPADNGGTRVQSNYGRGAGRRA